MKKAVKNNRISLHSGFLPWPFASIIFDKELSEVIPLLEQRGYISASEDLAINPKHFATFN